MELELHYLPQSPPPPREYQAHFTNAVPNLNGKVEGIWDIAPWSEAFVDIRGGTFPVQPWFQTRMKMLWDHECLYWAADLEEPRPWATYTERESVIFHENDIEIFLDPSGKGERYFELEINALGTTWDLFLERAYRDGGSADNSWDIDGLVVGVHVEGALNRSDVVSKGWSVTVAMPWSSFCERGATKPTNGDVWRINFSRVQWHVDDNLVKVPSKPEENWVWSPQYAIDMHRPEMWGQVQFIDSPVPMPKLANWEKVVEMTQNRYRASD